MERIAEFLRYLEKNEKEIELLFKELLINVTSFFRDPEAFAELGMKAIPGLLEHKDRDAPFRIWVPGCSTGEEAYSLAILLIEVMELQKKTLHCRFSHRISTVKRSRRGGARSIPRASAPMFRKPG